jgi:hypothetical protein
MRLSYSEWLYGQACAAGILDQIYEFRLLAKDLGADPRIRAIPTSRSVFRDIC